MILPAKIKDNAGAYFLKKILRTTGRKKRIANFENSKSIGILFDSTGEKDFEEVHGYVNKLQARNKEVRALGFITDPLMAKHLMPMLSFDYIYPSDLKWYGKPKTAKYKDFCEQDFDILIDISVENRMPLLFAAAESGAGFKIGRFSETNKPVFDMMIEVKDNEPLHKMIENFDHYINIIKPLSK